MRTVTYVSFFTNEIQFNEFLTTYLDPIVFSFYQEGILCNYEKQRNNCKSIIFLKESTPKEVAKGIISTYFEKIWEKEYSYVLETKDSRHYHWIFECRFDNYS